MLRIRNRKDYSPNFSILLLFSAHNIGEQRHTHINTHIQMHGSTPIYIKFTVTNLWLLQNTNMFLLVSKTLEQTLIDSVCQTRIQNC